MTEISITLPNWFLWGASGFMLVMAVLTAVEVRLKWRVFKAQKRAAEIHSR